MIRFNVRDAKKFDDMFNHFSRPTCCTSVCQTHGIAVTHYYFLPSSVKIPRVKTKLKVKRKAEVVTPRR